MSVPVAVFVIFVIAVALTFFIRRIAIRYNIVDHPSEDRKIHTAPTPLLGGAAVILAFIAGVVLVWPELMGGYMLPKHLYGVFIGAIILLIGGVLDDKYNISPKKQFIFPVLAALSVVFCGIGIEYITNPLGGVIQLDSVQWRLFELQGLPYHITLFADLFAIVWLLGMMYTTKFLDGLDGLVSGITVIGMFILFWLSLSSNVYQPETAWVAAIAGAAFFGFLLFNWNPAKMFLGESGSLFAGFILGSISIISGGKIATALLIMGIPILDVLWVIVRRTFLEKRSPFLADRKHLHLRLLDIGLSQRQAVLLLYALTTVFGVSSLFLQTSTKIIALGLLVLTMLIIGGVVVYQYKKKRG